MKMQTLALGLGLLLGNCYAQDASKGEAIYKKVNCALCHDNNAMGKAEEVPGKTGAEKWKLTLTKGPRIAGLSEDYIIERMKLIKEKGKVDNRAFATMMKSKIQGLSEQDLKDVAAYVSKKVNPSAGAHKGIGQ